MGVILNTPLPRDGKGGACPRQGLYLEGREQGAGIGVRHELAVVYGEFTDAIRIQGSVGNGSAVAVNARGGECPPREARSAQ
ncbi:hypothetical protein GCM10010349_36020 [Streptomyces flavofungini]|nr:hypothetical protein GCM10010349_36020 [Streptomyces flavofungini]